MSRPRILLADDHLAMLETEVVLLSPHFDVVGTTTDGHSLVSEALRLNPDLIVADITMPVLNGIEAACELRKSGCAAKFVFLTVHSEEEFVEACMNTGALAYVKKSAMRDHLVPAIKAALAGQSYFP